MNEYEYALHCVLWGKWDELFTLMLKTEDDILKKQIEQFLHAYYYAVNQRDIIDYHDRLIHYLDYAIFVTEIHSLHV